MGRKKRLIIPVFVPFGGCPNQCVFCDQKGITGETRLPAPAEAAATIEAYLSTWKGEGAKEVAFYGGSFTALPDTVQIGYLETAFGYVKDGRIDSVRVSTRPDCVSVEAVERLKGYGVTAVELGAQSMSDDVLRLSGRGHTKEATIEAVRLLKGAGLKVGLQFMPGLPGDTKESVLRTTVEIIGLRPDFVRVYPTLVLKGTPLYRMYLAGAYAPWTLDETAGVCAEVALLLHEAGVPIIRMGLQPTKELENSLVAGPYHPSFRQLVESRVASGPSTA